jgi:hypothetical protein
MTDPNTIMSLWDQSRQAQAKLNDGNKAAAFDVLAAANITDVRAEFDGCGDSGQIESVLAYSSNDQTPIPAVNVTIQEVAWNSTVPTARETSLADAIETLCYSYLAQTHAGWENNDGAYGEFKLNTAERTIELEFIGRYTETYTDTHSF